MRALRTARPQRALKQSPKLALRTAHPLRALKQNPKLALRTAHPPTGRKRVLKTELLPLTRNRVPRLAHPKQGQSLVLSQSLSRGQLRSPSHGRSPKSSLNPMRKTGLLLQ